MGYLGTNACTFAFKVGVHHDLSIAFAVTLDDVFKFMSQHEPKIVNAVVSH